MIKAILFDCYGVLYPDTFWTLASKYLSSELAFKSAKLHDLLRQTDLGYITREQLWSQFATLCVISEEELYADLEEFSGLDKRLLKLIDELKLKYKVGMISNVGQGFIERMFTSKPATEYFDSIVLSSDVGLVKPDRRIYEYAANDLGVELSECLFIDDLEKNVEGAKRAGMQAIQYESYEYFIECLKQFLN